MISPYAEDTTCLCHQKWRNKAGTQLEASDIIIIALKSTIFVNGGEGIHQSNQAMSDESYKETCLQDILIQQWHKYMREINHFCWM